jgi:DNA-binding MarR family transcriptional regulator
MSAPPEPAAEARIAIEELRAALSELFGAERRLRSRDHHSRGGLTQAQLRALAALGREQEMTAGQLARAADLNPATITALLDQLEAADIVQRQRSVQDRRVCNVSLTPSGRQLLEAKLARWQSLWEERFGDFSDRDLETTARVLGQIAELLDTHLPSHGSESGERDG